MAKVGIVTDSTNCLSEELLKEYDIRVTPVSLIINGKAYRDRVDITPDEFWRVFKGLKKQPTTSAANPGDLTNIFTELAKSTDGIVCIMLSKALSATHEAAVQARETVRAKHPNLNIEIVDSKTAAGALGFIVLEAARAAQAGKSLAEVVEVVQAMVPRVKFVVGMDTLRYLIKSGRAPKTAWAGELLQVKPIIGMVSGTGLVEALGKVRGKKKCLLQLVAMARKYLDIDKPIHLMVHYTDSIEDGEELKNLATSRLNCAELYLTPFTPVMASQTGPVVALSFYS